MSKSENTRTVFPIKKILVSTDGSDNAKRAVSAASSLAKQNGSELVIVHVVSETIPTQYSPIGINSPAADYSGYFKTIEQDGMKLVNQSVQDAKNHGINARGEVLRTISSIVESVVEVANKENVDLIVMGTRGLGGFKKLLLGSVSSGVVSHAKCSVLIVR
ncbi:MAG: universal stress protein [Nitrososphaerota archaeon]|jgi:nucleotide-binding universal stress UspA family protein|nr:universal stress protein [Nitrososphaerota archaeon]MDG6923759.1 universal stress protein [Nitrososphaerota archaeon]